MIAAEVSLTSSSKTNKMRRKLLSKLMALNLAAKRLKFSFTNERTRTRTRSSPSQTTTFTFRACLKVPVRPSFKNCSRNSVKFCQALCARQTPMTPFRTLGLFASKMQVQPTKQSRNWTSTSYLKVTTCLFHTMFRSAKTTSLRTRPKRLLLRTLTKTSNRTYSSRKFQLKWLSLKSSRSSSPMARSSLLKLRLKVRQVVSTMPMCFLKRLRVARTLLGTWTKQDPLETLQSMLSTGLAKLTLLLKKSRIVKTSSKSSSSKLCMTSDSKSVAARTTKLIGATSAATKTAKVANLQQALTARHRNQRSADLNHSPKELPKSQRHLLPNGFKCLCHQLNT